MKKMKTVKSMILLLAVLMMVVLGCVGCAQGPSADRISHETTTESALPSDIQDDDGESENSQAPHAQGEITLPEVVITQ